jgi:hypothetical protein
MRKNQKDALLLVKKLKYANQLDFTMRGIPMSAVVALVRKGEIEVTSWGGYLAKSEK